MKKYLFVCMGNICRSPMAEGIVREVFRKNNISAIIDSAGTISMHQGESPDRRAQQELAKHNINISNLRARKITPYDLENFDFIFAMDKSNYDFIINKASESQKKKVDLFMNIYEPKKNISIPDPYYDNGFDLNYAMILKSAQVLASNILIGLLEREKNNNEI
ncbi:MAG: hypothetical protein AUJ98_09785 [Bacteroidetes bacterium CG2_30_33_31]|nr:MAG: hypothetical protein AUJ98_09785 [Bacteroidetes bacterium CG2_30_33_31]